MFWKIWSTWPLNPWPLPIIAGWLLKVEAGQVSGGPEPRRTLVSCYSWLELKTSHKIKQHRTHIDVHGFGCLYTSLLMIVVVLLLRLERRRFRFRVYVHHYWKKTVSNYFAIRCRFTTDFSENTQMKCRLQLVVELYLALCVRIRTWVETQTAPVSASFCFVHAWR